MDLHYRLIKNIMKKVLLFGALAAGLLAASCTKSEVTVTPETEGVGQKLVIGLSSGKDALKVKSGRPLLSEAAGQEIQNIDLYFVNSTTSQVEVVKKIGPAEWANAVPYGSDGAAGGMKLEVNLKASNGESLAANTEYTVYAVGYSTDDVFTNSEIEKGDAWTAKNALFHATSANGEADEIFAGQAGIYSKQETADDGSTLSYLTTSATGTVSETPVVVLNRQVAGITGYFTNIPAEMNGTPATLRLLAVKKYKKLNFMSLYGGETVTGNAAKTFIVNGSELAGTAAEDFIAGGPNAGKKGFVVYEMDLADWFKFGGSTGRATFADCDLNGDGYVGYLDALCYVYNQGEGTTADYFTDEVLANWSQDLKGQNGNQKLEEFWVNHNMEADPSHPQQLVAGSMFAGKFVIPFDQQTGVNTLELQLLDKDGKILTSWNVAIPSGEKNTADIAADNTPTGVIISKDESDYVYSIYRNHMYSLGSKGLNVDPENPGENPDDPDPKPDPDPDDDEDGDTPQDLTQNNLQIHVNDRWEIIHDMVID